MPSPRGRQARRSTTKIYNLITGDEFRARELKYTARLMDLMPCLNVLDEATIAVEDLRADEYNKEKWRSYTECDILPKPYSPPEVKRFFLQLRYVEAENMEKLLDWLLLVDERSVLDQNRSTKDRTRRTLMNEIRPEIGIEYRRNVDLAIKVLKSIEYYLDTESLIQHATPYLLREIINQKGFIQQEIRDFIDRYSYRILAAEDSNMQSVDVRTSEYFYDAENFQIHIWTLKDVPIRFGFLVDQSLDADLHMVNVTIQIPLMQLQDNLTIRGLHFNFDHFSEHAKSFEQEIKIPVDNLNASLADLFECLNNEWNMQMDLTAEIREKMVLNRIAYEEKLKLVEAEESQAKSKAISAKYDDKQKKSKKKVRSARKSFKSHKEPPIIQPDVFPDVWADFLALEQQQFESFIQQVYHPDVLHLTENEINLKKYLIVGGVYQFDFVTKPKHVDFGQFNLTWHMTNGNLHKRKVTAKTIRPSSIEYDMESGSTISQLSHLLPTAEKDMEDKLFVLKFKLPKYLCIWGEPIACHFEADIEGIFERLSSVSMIAAEAPTPIAATAKTAGSLEMLLRKRDTTTSLGVNRTSSMARSSNVFLPLLTAMVSQLRVLKEKGALKADEDFKLNLPLTKTQIRSLKTHCLPQILSSFRFPLEDNDTLAEDPETKSGLLRRHSSADEDEKLGHQYGEVITYEEQTNPERIFPIFSNKDYLIAHAKALSKSVSETEPETFWELFTALDRIKTVSIRKYDKLLKMPVFTPKIQVNKINYIKEPDAVSLEAVEHRATEISLSDRYKKKMSMDVRWKSDGGEDRLSKKSGSGVDSKRSTSEMTTRASRPSQKHRKKETNKHDKHAKDSLKTIKKYSHWTKDHIYQSNFDRKNATITIWTDRLGTIGFASKRYEHFPFRFWSVAANENNPSEVIVTISTKHVKCVIFVSSAGYRGYVTEDTDKFVRNAPMYLVIDEPLNDLTELKKRFCEKNVNIFSKHDARFYIEDGYFSEKHLAMEVHTYNCMAINCSSLKFHHSVWNRLSNRRDIILRFGQQRDPEDDMILVHITPEGATFVEVDELCEESLNSFNLNYTLTWRNIDVSYKNNQEVIVETSERLQEILLVC